MTWNSHFLRDYRYLLGWGAVLLLALTAHSQPPEILRTYLLDEVRSSGVAIVHTAWLVFAVGFLCLVFGAAAAAIAHSRQQDEHEYWSFPVAVAVMASVPLLCVLIGFASAFVGALDVQSVRAKLLWGLTGSVVLALAVAGLPLVIGKRDLGRRVATFVGSPRATRLLDVLALALAVYFLLLPLGPSWFFVDMAVAMGALPILLISIGVIAHVLHRVLSHTSTSRTALAAWIVFVVLALAVAIEARTIGNVALILGLAILVFALMQFRQRLGRYRANVLRSAALAGVVFAFGDAAPANLVRTLPAERKEPMADLGQAFDAWFAKRVDKAEYEDSYPVFIIAAQGGGLYAAYHSAMVLAYVQDRCPRFAQHVFAVSGVSGGSLGAAVFSNAIARHGPALELAPCAFAERADAKFTRYVNTFLEQDMFSPLLFLTIIPNLAQRVLAWIPARARNTAMGWINYDRALGLEYAFERASARADGGTGWTSSFFKSPFMSLWSPDSVGPALILSATRADNGERYSASPFRLGLGTERHSHEADIDVRSKVLALENPRVDISLATASGLSARFPFVTPPGTMEVAARRWLEEHPAMRPVGLVDGGYFENSGLATAFEMASTLKLHLDQRKEGPSFQVIVITVGDVEGLRYSHFQAYQVGAEAWFPQAFKDRLPAGDLRNQPVPELLAPLTALNASREHRSLATLLSMAEVSSMVSCLHGQHRKCSHRSVVPGKPATGLVMATFFFGLTTDNPLPLGWQLSSMSRNRIASRLMPVPCGDKLEKEPEKWQAAMEALRAQGEDVGAYADAWLNSCTLTLRIQPALQPKKKGAS